MIYDHIIREDFQLCMIQYFIKQIVLVGILYYVHTINKL